MKNFKINQALVCMDLSDIDNVVLDYLNYMNPRLKIGSMNFLHVVRRPGFLSAIFDSNKDSIHNEFVLNEDILKLLIDNVESKIVDLEGTHAEYEVEEGNPLNNILASSKEHHADLLVIGKKSGDESSGNLGKSLARLSAASILSIPAKAKNKLDNILVPVDFSENSGKALQTAIQLNYQLETPAKIYCVHIFEMPDLSYYKINKTYEQLKNIIEADMQFAFDKFIEKYAPNMGDMLVKKSILREALSTAGQLTSLCADYDADLVIMGAKGHSALNSIIIGSVTEKFIQMNDFVPTLLVKS
jgi:nucleotide-binding universal stress UspA family protein